MFLWVLQNPRWLVEQKESILDLHENYSLFFSFTLFLKSKKFRLLRWSVST
jgi:hypothetical protein